MNKYLFSKWFFDLQLSGSEYLVVFISEVRCYNIKLTYFQFQGNLKIKEPGNPSSVNFFRRIHLLESDAGRWEYKEGSFETGKETFRMKFVFPDMEISLQGVYPDVDFSGKELFFKTGREVYLNWYPLFMNAGISGFLTQDGQRREFSNAPGYGDKVVSTILPWKLPVKKLFWGRWIHQQKALTFSIILNRQNSILASGIIFYNGFQIYKADIKELSIKDYGLNAQLNLKFPERYAVSGKANVFDFILEISEHKAMIISDFMRNIRLPGGLMSRIINPRGIKFSAKAGIEICTEGETMKLHDTHLIDEYVVF